MPLRGGRIWLAEGLTDAGDRQTKAGRVAQAYDEAGKLDSLTPLLGLVYDWRLEKEVLDSVRGGRPVK